MSYTHYSFKDTDQDRLDDEKILRGIKELLNNNREQQFNNVFVITPANPNIYIDRNNLEDRRDRKLLELLDILGLDYVIVSATSREMGNSPIENFLNSRLRINIPHEWSEDYQAISRRLEAFEAKQHI